MRQSAYWIGTAILLSIFLPTRTDTHLHLSSALAEENQPLFIGDVLNPLAFGQPMTAHEIPAERTEKAAVFDLGGQKRAAVSNGSPLFTQEDGKWMPIEETGHIRGDAFVFDRLAEGVDISFDLRKPSYTLMQDGRGFTVSFSGDAKGNVIDDRSIQYILADGVTLRWTVDGNHVHKDIRVEKRGVAASLSFTITPTDTLHLQKNGDQLSLIDANNKPVFIFDAPFLAGADGAKLADHIALQKSGNQYQYVFDESELSLPYIIDPSQGPNSPGTIADDTTLTGNAWSNVSNATTSNDTYATATLDTFTAGTHYLKATNFGFSIPSGATINGIVAAVEGKVTDVDGVDRSIKLVKGGTIQGNEKARSFPSYYWSFSDDVMTFGASNDLWGLTLADTDINASNFGFVVSAGVDGGGAGPASVDQMTLTVYYTAAAGGTVNIPVFPSWSFVLLLPGSIWILRKLKHIEA